MKRYMLYCLMALLGSSAQASDWTDADTAREVVFVATLVADHNQTRDIQNHADLHETNKMLGRHPGDARVRNYFIGAALGHYVVARSLPAGWPRQSFQYVWITLQVAQVIRNKRIGLTASF